METRPTIVLVHGAWHGSWCWDDVAAALRSAGYEVLVPDLPGHETPGSSARFANSLGSYVEHVDQLVESIDGDVVLVGHSMGGLVTQRVCEGRTVAHAVLVASIPRKGAGGALGRLAQNHPEQLFEAAKSLSLWPLVATDERVRGHFFGSGASSEAVESAGSRMQNESLVAFVSMILRWPRPENVTSPVSVVAATQDGIFTLAEQADLAKTYGTELVQIDCGHDIMLEPQHTELVELIIDRAGG